MNGYEVSAAVMLAGAAPLGWVMARRRLDDAVVALEAASTAAVLILALLVQGLNRSGETELPLLAALLSLGAGLVLARYLASGAE